MVNLKVVRITAFQKMKVPELSTIVLIGPLLERQEKLGIGDEASMGI